MTIHVTIHVTTYVTTYVTTCVTIDVTIDVTVHVTVDVTIHVTIDVTIDVTIPMTIGVTIHVTVHVLVRCFSARNMKRKLQALRRRHTDTSLSATLKGENGKVTHVSLDEVHQWSQSFDNLLLHKGKPLRKTATQTFPEIYIHE